MGKGAEALKLVGVAALWLSTGRLLPDLLWRAMPDALTDVLSLPGYSMICQVVTTLVGLGAARLVLTRPAEALGLRKPAGWDLALAGLLAPALFVVASFVALKIAEPYLVAEIAREGAGASRRNAGAFGKAITQAPLLVTLVWGAVLAAIAEELAFRGALFGAVEKCGEVVLARAEGSAQQPRPAEVPSIVAVVVTAVAFGAMHADMKGSVGIVRVASSTFLGLACGTARLRTRTVLVPMTLHFVYNSVSVGLGRGVFRGDSDPILSVVPNRLLLIAALGVFAVVAGGVARHAARGQASS